MRTTTKITCIRCGAVCDQDRPVPYVDGQPHCLDCSDAEFEEFIERVHGPACREDKS